MKKIKVMMILMLMVLIKGANVNVFASEVPYSKSDFINDITFNYSEYYVTVNQETQMGDICIVMGIVKEKVSVSIYYEKDYAYLDNYLLIDTNGKIQKLNCELVGAKFNISYDGSYPFKIQLCKDGVETPYAEFTVPTYTNIYELRNNYEFVSGRGNANFPSDTLTTYGDYLKGFFMMIMVVGIFIIGILSIIITYTILKKKTNIKRDNFTYYDPREYLKKEQKDESPEEVIDVTYEENHQEQVIDDIESNEEKSLDDILRELYGKRYRGEITEEQLQQNLRKYMRDRDED